MSEEATFYSDSGLRLLHKGKHDEAIDFLTKAIELKPDCIAFYNNRAQAYTMTGRTEKAAADIQQAQVLKSEQMKKEGLCSSSMRTKYNLNEIDTRAFDDFFDEDKIELDNSAYDFVFSDDDINSENMQEILASYSSNSSECPAILDFLDGSREEIANVFLFQPTDNDLTLIYDKGDAQRVVLLDRLSCIRLAELPPECRNQIDSSCHIEIIETVNENIYHEKIPAEQHLKQGLIGISTKDNTHFPYSFFPFNNVKKRCQERHLGEILIEKKFISRSMLQRSLEDQQRTKEMKLGKIIARHARILYSKVKLELVKAQRGSKKGLKTGEILLDSGLVNEEQVLEALAIQKNLQNKKIGRFLIEKGFLQEKEVYISLAEKFRIPFVDLKQQTVSKKILAILPPEIILKFTVLPLAIRESSLVVATLLPDVTPIKKMIQQHCEKQKIQFVLAQPTHLKNVINLLYKRGEKAVT